MERKIKVPYKGKQVDAVEVDFSTSKEDWSVYELNDGTIVRMKLVITNIARVKDLYDDSGNPIYVVRSSNVLSVTAPPDLMEKGKLQ